MPSLLAKVRLQSFYHFSGPRHSLCRLLCGLYNMLSCGFYALLLCRLYALLPCGFRLELALNLASDRSLDLGVRFTVNGVHTLLDKPLAPLGVPANSTERLNQSLLAG